MSSSRWSRLLVAALVAAAALTLPSAAPAQTTVPPGFQETIAINGLDNPISARFSPDGRVFVAEQNGRIKVYDSLTDTSPTIFADLSAKVHNFWDRGLLGIALAPNFPADPSVYALYTHDAAIGGTAPRWGTGSLSDPCPTPPGPTTNGCVVSGRLSRLAADGNVMTGPEQVLVEGWCQQFPSHSVGSIAFGPDGALYASAGDGASFNFADYGQNGNPCGDPPGGTSPAPPNAEGGALRAQDLRTPLDPVGLNGSVIRVDPTTGAGLPDNPLGLSSDANARRIVAYGMRNPFRIAVRPGTNEVWVGDVGWNDFEEIDRIVAPNDTVVDNFGWPCREGPDRQDGYDDANLNICENLYTAGDNSTAAPYFYYNHDPVIVPGEQCSTGSSSVTGLAFYTGGNYPGYDGGLFFADNARGCIWFMKRGANGLPDPNQISNFVSNHANPVDIQIGPGGDLFYVDYDNGQIRRIRFTGANQPPTARAQANPVQGPAPLTVQFDGSTSSDPEGSQLAYEWDLDDDGDYDDSTSATPSFTYTASRQYTVRLRVRDAGGATGTDVVVVTVGNNGAPVPTITSPTNATTWKVGDPINFAGSASDPQDGALPASALSWKLIIHHCPSNCHTHQVQDFVGVASGSFSAPDHEYPSHLELQLTARDSDGAQATTSVLLQPQTVELTLRASHPGLRLTAGGTSTITPFNTTVIVGSANSISAPSPQTVGGNSYTFQSWSDGGAQSHNIVAPETPTTYVATFEERRTPPVAAYSFDEGSGTSVADATDGGHGGAVSGATWTADGRFGSALTFDGIDDRVAIPDHSELDLATGMTLEAWVRPSALASWRTVLFKAGDGGHVYALYGNDSATRPLAEASIAADVEQARGTAALATGQWTHLTATYDGANLRLYANGALATTTPAEGVIDVSGGELWIGGNPIWSEWFAGEIDEVRVYDRPLDAAEIQDDMNRRVGVSDTTAPTAPTGLDATGGRGSVQLSWTAATDDVGVHHYDVHRGTTAGFTPTTANRIAQPTGTTYTDGGLAAGTYHYLVKAVDAAGNAGPPSNGASATATADTTGPTVSITEPAAGATVSSNVTLRANATDDDAVAGVQFKVDGANVGSEDTSAPYSVTWDSRSVANGSHQITAVARDPSSNSTTSSPLAVLVDNSSAPPPTGLVAAYGFDEGNGTSVSDASGTGNGGAITGAAWSTQGRFGNALQFDGVDDRVVVADAASLDLSPQLTLEAWVRPTLGGGWRTALAKESGDTVAYSLYTNRSSPAVPTTEVNLDGRLRFANGTAAAPLNAWTHLASTYDGTTIRLYVNGTQVGTTGRTGAMAPSAGPLSIGGNGPHGEWFQGLLDEVRVYNRALTAAEIQTDMNTRVGVPDTQAPGTPGNLQATGGLGSVQLTWSAASDDVGVHHYNVHRGTTAGFTPTAANRIAQPTGTGYTDAGLAAGTYHYVVTAADAAGNVGPASGGASATATADTTPPTVSVTAPAAGATVSGTVTISATATDDVGVAGVEFKVDGTTIADDTSAPYSVPWDSRGSSNGARDITAVARDAAGNPRTSAAVQVTVDNSAAPPPPGLVAAYGFDESTGTSVADRSGTGNTGTLTGPAWTTSGHFGSALSFDGIDDRVVVADANSLDLTTGMTLEAWVRPTAAGGVWRSVVAKNGTGTVAYNLYANRNTNRPAAEMNIGGSLRIANGTAQLALNAWSHVAATYDGTTIRLYVNGTQVGTGAFAGSLLSTTGQLWIGGNAVWSEWFAGTIDDVRVYNRALTAAQIQADMSAPVS
jgi:glucose/arabinose dehydrogenase